MLDVADLRFVASTRLTCSQRPRHVDRPQAGEGEDRIS
jgi:hypothetical protein